MLYYYGTPAGYIEEHSKQAVLDELFHCPELERWLQNRHLDFRWSPGIFEKITEKEDEGTEHQAPLNSVRIWQLKPEADITKKFIPYHRLVELHQKPTLADYRVAFDGRTQSNNLEEIYSWFLLEDRPGFKGHPLSISDLMELYDHETRSFYYIDKLGFCPVSNLKEEQQ